MPSLFLFKSSTMRSSLYVADNFGVVLSQKRAPTIQEYEQAHVHVKEMQAPSLLLVPCSNLKFGLCRRCAFSDESLFHFEARRK